MKTSAFHLATTRETPADAEIASHQLMLRTGMIRKLTSGIYTWSPLGWRVLRKVESIVRQEMDRAGFLELLMPAIQPAELWQETERWEQFGGQLLKISDRQQRDYCFGPTHEEVITDFARNELRSYKQLPVTFYQIQTKFRDEIRPRFGIMRAREFLMKDAYSFHLTQASLEETYWQMYEVYSQIFTRAGLRFRAVQADSGAIGGNASHEFHVLADSGEDVIAFSDSSDYAANIELAEALTVANDASTGELKLVDTPDAKTIQQLVEQFELPIEQTVKTLIVAAAEDSGHDYIALLVRGDHELNEVKASKHPLVASPLQFADDQVIKDRIGAGPGSLGPIDLPIPCVVDHSVAALQNFAAGANQDGKHYFGICWGRDVDLPEQIDLRNVQVGDPSPDGQGQLKFARGIEVGHIFQLGTKYSESMGAVVLDEQGKAQAMAMGCYGIGVSRIVAAAIEQNHDDKGIRWPEAIAPFQVTLLPVNMHKSSRVQQAAEQLYQDLLAAGVEVLFDDRPLRPGVIFTDAELIGIPHQVVIGERALDRQVVEYKNRHDGSQCELPLADLCENLIVRLHR